MEKQAAPRKRVRLARVQVTFELFVDDGQNLEPLEVQPVTIPGSQIADLPAVLQSSLSELEQKLNQPDKP